MGIQKLTIYLDTYTNSESLRNFSNQRFEASQEGENKTPLISTILNNEPAYQFTTEVMGFNKIYLLTSNKNKGVQISVNYSSKSEDPNYESLANQILSTFTFTEKLSPTGSTKPLSLVIPNHWQKSTATDPQFKVTTSLSLPPDYTFTFTGSEFLIQSSNAQELWLYFTSVSANEQGVPYNSYTGGSRRQWYQDHLDGKFGTVYGDWKIINTKEVALNQGYYLQTTIQTPTGNETHYLYNTGNLIHILRPASHKANSTDSELSSLINLIFTSLSSSFKP
jgi:hypothetical protein